MSAPYRRRSRPWLWRETCLPEEPRRHRVGSPGGAASAGPAASAAIEPAHLESRELSHVLRLEALHGAPQVGDLRSLTRDRGTGAATTAMRTYVMTMLATRPCSSLLAVAFLLTTALAHPSWAADENAVTARRVTQPVHIDGVLDDADWALAEPASGFVQSDPHEGQPATERTEVRVLFDADHLYFGVYCYDSEPDGIMVNDLRRDFNSYDSDAFGIALDPLHDHRNGFTFFTNAAAAMNDSQGLNDGRISNLDWDGIWHVAARRREDGWSAEIVVPFKTLGLRSGTNREMGVNFKRRIRRKNEESYWSLVPRRFNTLRTSLAGVLTGLDEVRSGLDLRVKPFLTTEAARLRSGPDDTDDLDAELGVDVKYRINHGLALDLTYNTDFSQVEVDTEQINLTRFNLFFPEKREFFLENAGIFQLGDISGERGTGGETQAFYSRRIGLSPEGRPLPLLGGARLSGHAGPYAVGLLNIQQERSGTVGANNFTVARVTRDILSGSGSDFGAIFVNRQGEGADNYNRTYGADLNLQFNQRVTVNSFVAATQTPGLARDNVHTKASGEWDDGRFVFYFAYADVGENFRPEVGFVPRAGVRNYQLNTAYHFRPGGNGYIREIHPNMNVKYFTDRDNLTLTKDQHYEIDFRLRDGGQLRFSLNPQFDRLEEPFRIRPGVVIPAGDYFWDEYRILWSSDASRRFSTSGRFFWGTFYDGEKTSATVTTRVNIRPHLATQMSYTTNIVDLRAGSFRADLYSLRASYDFNPRMFVDAFVQYNTDTDRILTNLRFRLMHRPLSDISLALNEDRASGLNPDVARSIIVKYTHLLQF
jgi:hypothetical protein